MFALFMMLFYNSQNMAITYFISFAASFIIYHVIYFIITKGPFTERLFMILFYDTLYTIALGSTAFFEYAGVGVFYWLRIVVFTVLLLFFNFVYLKKIVPQLIENIELLEKENTNFCLVSVIAFIVIFFQTIVLKESLMVSLASRINFIFTALLILSIFPLMNILCKVKGESANLQAIEHFAKYDSLTNILNRRAGSELIDDILRESLVNPIGALFVLDLDKFKQVNDTYGHNEGDLLLKSLAQVLTERSGADVICRTAGDEFVLYYNKLTSSKEINDVAQKLFNDIQQKFDSNECWNKVSVSIGIKLRTISDDKYLQLFIDADKAMYCSKNSIDQKYTVAD